MLRPERTANRSSIEIRNIAAITNSTVSTFAYSPGSARAAYQWVRQAMDFYEQAEALRPPGNDDALLRWNTCARIIEKNRLVAREEENVEPPLE